MSPEENYPPFAVAADSVVFTMIDGGLHVLLIQRGRDPFAGAWALPGGFVEIDEDLLDAARRELSEETGLKNVELVQLQAFGAPGRDPRGRVISIAHLGFVKHAQSQVRAADDAAAARWFPTDQLPQMAFDHAAIIRCAIDRFGSSHSSRE